MSKASGGTSSADACSNGHAFIFAGGTMPEGWPCQCGKTRWTKDGSDMISRKELTKWLDIEIAMVEENLEQAQAMSAGFKAEAMMQSMLATYKAVKTHINQL